MPSRLAAFVLRLIGWQALFTPPPGPKTVIMVYPHTSNWDFVLGMLFKLTYRFDIRWAGKDSLFRGPFGRFFTRLGGVPINRRVKTGMVDQLLEKFARNESFHFCIAPEGTRSKTDHLKTGFYWLALKAKVPLGLAFIDYRHKRVGVEQWIQLSGNETVDLERLRNFYADIGALDPAKSGEIRFKS